MDAHAWLELLGDLGPLLALVGALIAALVAYFTYRHRRKQDQKEQWWLRTQWALDHVVSPGELDQMIGLDILAIQARSSLADAEDKEMLDRVATTLLVGAATDDLREDEEYNEEYAGSDPSATDGAQDGTP